MGKMHDEQDIATRYPRAGAIPEHRTAIQCSRWRRPQAYAARGVRLEMLGRVIVRLRLASEAGRSQGGPGRDETRHMKLARFAGPGNHRDSCWARSERERQVEAHVKKRRNGGESTGSGALMRLSRLNTCERPERVYTGSIGMRK
jgi:hypothetical protein